MVAVAPEQVGTEAASLVAVGWVVLAGGLGEAGAFRLVHTVAAVVQVAVGMGVVRLAAAAMVAGVRVEVALVVGVVGVVEMAAQVEEGEGRMVRYPADLAVWRVGEVAGPAKVERAELGLASLEVVAQVAVVMVAADVEVEGMEGLLVGMAGSRGRVQG